MKSNESRDSARKTSWTISQGVDNGRNRARLVDPVRLGQDGGRLAGLAPRVKPESFFIKRGTMGEPRQGRERVVFRRDAWSRRY